ncbi:MAG: toxin-antitoxin system YwqK family antitoxin [Bacteroidales bacterium]|nr:toxin-antitoxin system YwqK family antitoxin [Bacteroidales bacterium]
MTSSQALTNPKINILYVDIIPGFTPGFFLILYNITTLPYCFMEGEDIREVFVDKLELKEDLYFKKGDDVPFTGRTLYYFENDQMAEEINFRKGLRHGKVKMWNEKGIPIVEADFINGEKHGQIILWYDDGQKRSVVNLKKNKREGESKIWYKNGAIKLKANYKNDMLHGTQMKYFPNGKVKIKVDYSENLEDGVKTIWKENGEVLFEGRFKKGELI